MSVNETTITQAAAIPYRMDGDRPEFCLITSTGKGNWIFPKGIVDPGETPAETALKEAHEEAGLHGVIEKRPLGQYTYEKWNAALEVTALLMRVTAADETWAESEIRRRCWCDAEQARAKLSRDELCDLLDAACQRLGGV
ncbi:MAG: NUDIX hydrolase [Pirellulales bacterium]|nr:NUDIX hydrolase [Pirellulales bacterium]